MKAFVSVLLLVASSFTFAASSCDKMMPYGYPVVSPSLQIHGTKLCRIAYFVNHNDSYLVPIYSASWLLPENLDGENTRINAFKPDPDLPVGGRAELADYINDPQEDGTEYDRGHMVPVDDMRKDSAAMLQSFYLSNMVPQDYRNNRGIWKSIEGHVRKWAKARPGGLYVFSGPIFDTWPPATIGPSHVGVPTRLFKVVINKATGQGVAFLVNNGPYAHGVSYTSVMTTIKEVEEIAKINFAPLSASTTLKTQIGAEFIE